MFLRGRLPTRVYTIATVLAVLTPALILMGFLATREARFERTQLEQNAIDQTREATATIEHDAILVEDVLETLGNSRPLQQGDIATFHAQATAVSQKLGSVLFLYDRNLTQLANTAVAWGTPLGANHSAQAVEAQEEVLRSGKIVFSNVFLGTHVKAYVVAVMVPIFYEGDLRFILGAGVPIKRFGDLLGNLNIRKNQIVGVIDRNGTFVARSKDNDKYAGTHARVVPQEAQDIANGVNREGEAFRAFSRHSALLGWSIATGVPDRVLAAPMKHAITNLIVWGALLLAGGLALAEFLARRLLQSAGKLGIDRRPTSEEFEILFNSSPNGEMVIDDGGRIVLLNAKAAEKFGYSQSELIGQAVEILVPDRLRNKHPVLRQAFAGKPQARSMGVGRDLYGRRKDGSEFPVEVGLNPIKSGSDNLVMMTVVDISKRKLAAEQINAARIEREVLRRRLIHAQEQERLHLAHELHDQTGQTLAAAMLQIKGFEDTVNESDRARLRLLRAQLEQVGQTLRHVAWELRPASIDELGLESALANYLAEWSQRYGIESDFHYGDLKTDALSEEKCTAIFRVIQEALTNVVKHAQRATQVSVVIEPAGKNLGVTIEDNGCGFDTASLAGPKAGRNGGLGLAGMQERLTLFGGEFEVESSVGVGTAIFARIPLELEKDAA